MPFDLATAKPVGASGFDLSTARPVQDEPAERPPVTALDRVNALATGVNEGVARTVGFGVDRVADVRDLLKALVGSGYIAVTDKAPPDWLQIGDRGEDVGSGQFLVNQLNKIPGRPADTPRPDDAASRYLHAGGAGATAALLAPGSSAAAPISAASRFAPSAIAGVSGAEATQLAAEHGASPLVQVAAGVAGGVLPSAGRVAIAEGARRVVRGGGEEARQRVAQNVQDFENAGTTPTAGQAGETRFTRATESLLAKTPGAAGRMAAKAESQGEQLGSNIERLAAKLSPKASGEQAGRAIQRGVTGDGGFIQTFKAKSSENYNALDSFVKKDAPFVLPKTEAALTDLTSAIVGAEKTSKFFINSKISDIKEALSADLKTGKGTLPYEAVKKIRSIVGEQLADAPFNGDVPRSQWKKLYAALSEDLAVNAKASGPEAERALARANQYHAAGMKRLDVISSVIEKNGGPEAVFRAATSGAKEGASTLRAVMQSLPADAQKMLSASVLRRMGRAKAGSQDELGERFSTETFLTNWNTMSPQAKATLFDRYGAGFRQDMDSVAKVAANLRAGSAVFRNPSGTGQSLAQSTTAATVILSVLSGNFKVAAAIAGAAGTANVSARLLTNPNVVKWLAKSTKAPGSALPALINLAAQSEDEDLRDLAKLLKQSRQAEKQGNNRGNQQ